MQAEAKSSQTILRHHTVQDIIILGFYVQQL